MEAVAHHPQDQCIQHLEEQLQHLIRQQDDLQLELLIQHRDHLTQPLEGTQLLELLIQLQVLLIQPLEHLIQPPAGVPPLELLIQLLEHLIQPLEHLTQPLEHLTQAPLGAPSLGLLILLIQQHLLPILLPVSDLRLGRLTQRLAPPTHLEEGTLPQARRILPPTLQRTPPVVHATQQVRLTIQA